MDKRDHAFLQDVMNFIYMNRVATAFSLGESIINPQLITAKTVRGIHGGPHPLLDASKLEELLNQTSTKRIPGVQSIMIARIYAELIASYEDLGAFCWAIKKRKTEGKGILGTYLDTRDGSCKQFYQSLVNRMDGTRPKDPPVTLGDLLKLPSIRALPEQFPRELLPQLEQNYLERPALLYDIAKLYLGKLGDTWRLATHLPPGQVATQDTPTTEVESYIHVIMGIIPMGEQPQQDKITTEVFNKIKHIFMVTENLSAYEDQTNPVQVLFATFKRDPLLVQEWIDGIKTSAGLMNDIASLLILLDHFGANL